MLNFSDTLTLSSKKIKQRKISSFFSIFFVAIGTIILLVSTIAIYSVINYLDTTTKGIEDTGHLVKLTLDCTSTSSQSTQLQRDDINQKIISDQQLIDTQQKILTADQIAKLQKEISDFQLQIANLSSPTSDKTCLSKSLDIPSFKQKNSGTVQDVFTSVDYSVIGDLTKTKDLKIDGIRAENVRNSDHSNPTSTDYANYLGTTVRTPVLNIEETFDKVDGSDILKVKESNKNSNSYIYISNQNTTFQTYDNDKFLAKYLDSGKSLSSPDSDIVNVILPGSFLQVISPSNSLDQLTNSLDPLTALTSSDTLNKADKYIVNQEKLKSDWLGKVVTFSAMLPSKVEYINNTNAGFGGYTIQNETITEYTRISKILKVRIVGFSGVTTNTIMALNSEFKKVNIEKLATDNSKGYISIEKSNSAYPSFVNEDSKSAFLNTYSNTYFGGDISYQSSFSSESGYSSKGYSLGDMTFQVSDVPSVVTQINDTFQTVVSKVLLYIGLAFLTIASLIMLLILSKSVTESTKEIAIFRSFGAKRFDIAKIYTSYSLMLVIIGFCLALGISYGLLLWANSSSIKAVFEITLYSAVTSNIRGHEFSFVSFPALQIFYIFLTSIAFGLLAAAIPIYRAVRIQPIVAMRND